jgi:SAM-dependent methyltransferase
VHATERSLEDFDEMYSGTPPWDIGRPQPAFVQLADAGAISGRVLDAGCGTGENALLLADRGLEVVGVDAAPKAIAAAARKAADRGLSARFQVWDALQLAELGEQFDTVIDSGLFHVFDDERRARYVSALGSVLRSGGRYFMLCFSDAQPGDWGPRRVRADEIRTAFAAGWTVDSIEPTQLHTNLDQPLVHAWLGSLTRVGAQ